ncbi:MAG: aminotransferase class V-fold PLP-dependent enzyme [Ectothiorhodospiraceae bacterium]|nr:aminotransferase class V-fold PLP-dependent enzyme [Chromatiales bacterium]MCP5153316.1 aminotransferase class V-fold PLP-dependent enzyme [Ectothiorhodospiraceae bacterium]
MTSIYESLGIPTIVNAKGTSTRVSGGLMEPEVAAAMREATEHCVDMATLQGRASEIIAEATGAEAGIVTSGAAAALLLGTAACITGLDPAKMNRLPDTRGMRNRVVMVRSQRNFYDHAVRAAGVEIVEVGLPDRFSGAGVRDAEAWEIAGAIDAHTACVLYVAQPHSRPALPAVAAAAHDAGIPVLVDAAAQLPPVENLRRFVAEGADLVAFSGGKAINGPQGSGILCGRRDLVAAALLQNLDLDLFIEQWRPPPSLFGNRTLPGLPHHGIGRSSKVGKEQIVALLVALQRFTSGGVEARIARCQTMLERIVAGLDSDLPARVEVAPHRVSGVPLLTVTVDRHAAGLDAFDLVLRLQDGTPSIHVDPSRVEAGAIVLDATCLRDEHPEQIAVRLNAILGAARRMRA